MLNKFIQKRFASKVYTVGWNYNNLGKNVIKGQEESEICKPERLSFDSPLTTKKMVSGYSESVLLTSEGEVYNFGANAIFNKIGETPQKIDELQNVRDLDVDQSHSIYLTDDGRVLEMDEKGINEVPVNGKVEMVACGKDFSMAVIGNEKGKQKLVAWPRNFNSFPSVFGYEGNKRSMHSIAKPEGFIDIGGLNEIIEMDKTKIKKIKIVGESVAVLLDNGVLATWGDNKTGNLGIPRSLMILYDYYIHQVKVPMLENGLTEYVKDFDISSNNIIMLTEKNEIYYAGRDKHLSLQKLPFFADKKIKSVGSYFNNYVIVTEEGEVFATEPVNQEKYVKYWGDYKLYQYSQEYFGNDKIVEVSGKYDNAYLLAQ